MITDEPNRGPEWTPLEPFQRLMLLWRSNHPYNAAHSLLLRGPADVNRLRVAVSAVCRQAGIGLFHLDPSQQRIAWDRLDDDPPIQIRAKCLDPLAALRGILADELNRAFAATGGHPLRWTVCESLDRDQHLLILCYDHVVADAFAVQALVAGVLQKYVGVEGASSASALTTHVPDQRGHVARSDNGPISIIRAGARTMRGYLSLRYAHRMHEARSGGLDTGVVTHSLSADRAGFIGGRNHRGVPGWNDLFLAATAVALARLTPQRRTHRQRRALGLGTIISLRERIQPGATVDFTCLLSNATVLIRRPDAEPRAVLNEVMQCTSKLKARRKACSSFEAFAVRRIWPMLRIRDDRAGYRKYYPLCAGVSTVVVDDRWYGGVTDRVLRVVRSCPTGPALPLVLAPTIRGNRVELSLTYRRACLDESGASSLLAEIASVLALPELGGLTPLMRQAASPLGRDSHPVPGVAELEDNHAARGIGG
ncbi:MAG: hypothetical protein J5J06_01785 [Phycisphaerae bacterium]|nr:hypothetical protein [Phycisphaerae bacterium]